MFPIVKGALIARFLSENGTGRSRDAKKLKTTFFFLDIKQKIGQIF